MHWVLQENVPLAPLTTLGVGGPARYFTTARNEASIFDAHQFAKTKKLPLFVLGSGSNIVVADEGFPGLVVHIAIPGQELISAKPADSQRKIYRVGAGVNWDRFVAFCVGQSLAGIECLSGIPGSIGGTPVQNVGAYGQEVSNVIRTVRVFDREEERIHELDHDSCGFAYRQSIFNTAARGRYIVLAVTYALQPDGAPTLRYPDIQNFFPDVTTSPSLQAVRDAVCEVRRRKAMLLVPDDPDCSSVGSFFKNPVVSESVFKSIAKRYPGVAIPHYPVANSDLQKSTPTPKVKLAAAWLIEQAGFSKGYPAQKRSPVGLSSKHTLAIINRGGASAQDVLTFMQEIQAKVKERFNIHLIPEPELVGFKELESLRLHL